MAEATVESPPCTSSFYCHECQRDVQPNIPAYTCSRCNGGFIEEVERLPDRSSQESSATTQPLTDPVTQMINNTFLNTLRHSVMGPHRYNTRLASQTTRASNDDSHGDESDDDELRGVAPNMLHLNTSTSDRQPGQQQAFQGIINYVIQLLGNDLGGRGQFVHLHGNPGDYAWGSGGLDAIISQLLNQLEGTGAPPAQRDRIENLPRVKIDKSQVESQLQCSICMEDYELDQEVRKLPCDHLYHSDCIIRWLEMHGTCPVCRKDLNGDDTSANETDFTTIFQTPGASNGPGNQSASASSSSSSTMSTDPSSSSSYSMDDDA